MTESKSLGLLAGVRILAFTQFLLGPAACQYLADMGADVIKVEPPGHGAWERSWAGAELFINGVSAFFLLGNRNLRSVTLNLKTVRGADAARKLAQRSDVIIENYRPGVMDRFGLGYEDLKKLNPSIVYASGSGYGSTGPYRHLPGQDLLIQAISGLGANTGTLSEGPTVSAAAVVDQHSASLLAMGILGALVHRERTREGQRVELIMMNAALDLQTEPVVYHLNGARLHRPRTKVADTFHSAPYGFYATADGHLAIAMAPINAISEVLGNPGSLQPYLDPGIAYSRRDEIRQALDPYFRKRATAEWITLLRAHDIWCAPVNSLAETFDDVAVQHIDPVLEFEHPRAGRVRVLRHPVSYSSGEATVRRLPPEAGEHTAEVLGELGYTSVEIAVMRAAKEI
ncbi:MAG: CoA transferase [Chloroflexi bacterium]|nr:MAG: CoA transferase [Chloroflexota bacterium]TMF82370.1 MAG: CoA transferase [Chloroflexota bacterium]TMG12535.1 MAG: CoA transferase [Chloroflexota bacterium]